MDKQGMRKMVLNLEKKITKNEQLRIKNADKPKLWVFYNIQYLKNHLSMAESDVELGDELKKLHVLATAPHLYPDFVQIGAPTSLLSLLAHENSG